ncbi:MAG: hypothetical protein V1832_03720 [Nitrospirota bacterium]|jgi:hypothetical protein
MLQRVHIQVLDNPLEEIILNEDEFNPSPTNRQLTEELRKEMNDFFPSVVFVEYIDLFMDGEEEFEEIRELLQFGVINTPIVLINGVLKIQGSIPTSVIKQEVEILLSSGPVH